MQKKKQWLFQHEAKKLFFFYSFICKGFVIFKKHVRKREKKCIEQVCECVPDVGGPALYIIGKHLTKTSEKKISKQK